ncbi:hypothetical protein BN2476_690007 [Paraburkholderia piptadeniae]|uniref:Uncharacterized protein n=1 Tax=Paraburkholderia piptadeniae TaxID=1701573 RepID=A0A1N7SRK9_9BURK|nr:hypothetical protein BN2476_690007 [Paraburkholderia piptadeniae]
MIPENTKLIWKLPEDSATLCSARVARVLERTKALGRK